jgi:formylglycine-generating enzyme required for sulfatase activity
MPPAPRALVLIAWSLFGCRSSGEPAAPPKPAAVASPLPPIALAMVAIPAGTFAMGSIDGDDDERPVHDARVAAFTLGRTEVTVAEYRACLAAGACTPTALEPYCNAARDDRADHPINCVTWEQAAAFCAWAGARLPTEVEWEYAARGPDGRRYPWGSDPPAAQLCWDGPKSDLGLGKRRGTCVAGAHPMGTSPFGALDMAGNVWEWTSTFYSDDYTAPGEGPLRVVRGGTWFGYDPHDVRATLRFRVRPEARNYGIGFRCAR